MTHQIRPPDETTVFLSYSRRDATFVRRLANALAARGYEPIFDQSEISHTDDPDLGLSAQDEWWAQLKTMIAASDVIVFVVTPDSARSPICDDEIAYAKSLGKRIIAILRRDIKFSDAPERLRALNVQIDFRADEDSAFIFALETLGAALDLDIEWHRRGARLIRQAHQWDKEGRRESHLLRSGAIADADSWATRRPREAPELGALLIAYLDESRAYEAEQHDRRRRTIGQAFVRPALQAVAAGAAEHALRLVAAGALLADDLDLSLVAALREPVARAIFHNKTECVLAAHVDRVRVSAFSPDGRYVVTASNDHTARVWDSISGDQIVVLQGHASTIYDASFSPDGRRIVTSSADGTARVWHALNGQQIVVFEGHRSEVNAASFSPDGGRIVTASDDHTARVWDAVSGRQVAVFEGHKSLVVTVSFSPDGRRIVSTSEDDSTAYVWSAETGSKLGLLKDPRGVWNGASFSPDGQRIVAASASSNVHLWSAKTFEEMVVLEGAGGEALFSPDGGRVVTAALDKTARIWDAETGQQIAVLKGHDNYLSCATFSPDGRRVVTASGYDGTVLIWDAVNGACIAQLKGHEAGVWSASFSSDGRRIVTASSDRTARIWDAARGEEIAQYLNETVSGVPFSADGRRFVTFIRWHYPDCMALIRDTESGEEIGRLEGPGVYANATFSPDGRYVVTFSNEKTVRVWDVGTGRVSALLEGQCERVATHAGVKVTSAAFSPDGRRIVTASNDCTARVWDSVSGKQVALLESPCAVDCASFSPDGRRILTLRADGTAFVWDAEDGKQISALNGRSRAAEFSPDGGRIVTASDDHTARVWDAVSGQQIVVLQGHRSEVNAASFSPDGGRVVTSSADGTARVWDAVGGQQVAVLEGSRASFSPDGRRILSLSASGGPPRVWDASSGAEIAAMNGHTRQVLSASFSPDGRRILTSALDSTTRMWDIRRTEDIAPTTGSVIAAALSRGLGLRTDGEARDVLMQDAPDNMFSEALVRLGSEQKSKVLELATSLRAPRHPNCYLSPTQLAEKSEALRVKG